MKRLCCLLVLVCSAFAGHSAFGQWAVIGQFDSPISVVKFMDDLGDGQLGYVGLSNGELWKTGDGGSTWSQLLVPGCNTPITALTFKTLTEGWLSARQVSPNPSIYHTLDAGVNWTAMTPTTERPSVYYNARTNLLFTTSLLNNDLVSKDGGVSWQAMQLQKSNGISFSDSLFGVMSNYRGISASATADGGVTWYPTPLGAEAWMPLAIKGVRVYYCASEVTSQIFRTTDLGGSWQTMARLNARLTGDIEGYCGQLYVQSDSGFYVSQDEGVTWTPIGGPPCSLSDVRFALVGYTLYAGDDHGQLWKFNDGSRPFIGRLYFTGAAPSLAASGCDPVDGILYIRANSACLQTILLNETDSLPPNAHASQLTLFPHLLDPNNYDSIKIRYTPSGHAQDTLLFQMHYSVGGAYFDTTLEILASSSPVLDVKSNPTAVSMEALFNCTIVKSKVDLTNGKCDSLSLDSVTFGDTDHFEYLGPKSSIVTPPKGTLSVPFSGRGDSTGVYRTVMTVHLSIRGKPFNYSIPVTLQVDKNEAVQTTISPTRMSFGSTSVCGRRDVSVVVLNQACESYEIDSVFWLVKAPGCTIISEPKVPRVLNSNDDDSIVVEFAPQQPGTVSGTLGVRFLVNGAYQDTIINVSGTGYTQSKARLSVSQVAFDSMLICAETDTVVYMRNESCDSTGIFLVNAPADHSFLVLSPTGAVPLAPGDSVPIHIHLLPNGAGLHHDSVEFWLQNSGGSQQVLDLVLNVIITPPVRSVNVSSSAIRQTSLFPCSVHDTTFTILNLGTCDTLSLSGLSVRGSTWFSASSEPALPVKLAPGDSLVVFVHTVAAPDSSTSGTLNVTGSRFDTSITLSASVAKYAGVALAAIAKDSVISSRICAVATGRVVYQNHTCGPITVDSVWLQYGTGNTQFILGPTSVPITIPSGDTASWFIIYNASGVGNDSTILHLHTSSGVLTQPTLVTGVVVGSPQQAALQLACGNTLNSIVIPSGSYTDLILGMRDIVSDTLDLTSVHARIAFNNDILTPSPPNAAVKPAVGWTLSSETDGVGYVDFSLVRQTSTTIYAGDALAEVHCYATVSDTLATPVTVTQVYFNGNDSMYARCTLAALPTVDTISVAISPVCGDSLFVLDLRGAPLIQSMDIVPDPSSAQNPANVRINMSTKCTLDIEVLDLQGRSVAKFLSQSVHPGSQVLPLRTTLATGTYFVLVSTSGQSVARKFFVQ